MLSIRRLIGSLMIGGLTLAFAAGSAAQAATTDVGALATALHGFEVGTQAVDDLLSDGVDGTFEDVRLGTALDTVAALVAARQAEAEAEGKGPVQAEAVLEALMTDTSPSELAPGAARSQLAMLYRDLKAQAKPDKPDRPDKPDTPDKPDKP